jgi:hypothetical protein
VSDALNQQQTPQSGRRRKLTQWQKVAWLVFALAATVLVLANEFKGGLERLRDADLGLMGMIASINPFQLVVLFFQGIADYFRGCPSGVAGDCPGTTAAASFFTAIAHGFEYIDARTPEMPFKPLLMAGAFFGSWLVGIRMAKSQGSGGNFFWIVPGLIGLSVICFVIQGLLWLLAGSAFLVLATFALIGGAVSVAVVAVLKSALAASEAKKGVELAKSLLTGKELDG